MRCVTVPERTDPPALTSSHPASLRHEDVAAAASRPSRSRPTSSDLPVMVNRYMALQEAEQEVEYISALVALSRDDSPLDDTHIRQALQQIHEACTEIGDIEAACSNARDKFKAAMLRPSDLLARHRFSDALSMLRLRMREARRAVATDEGPAIEPPRRSAWTARARAEPVWTARRVPGALRRALRRGKHAARTKHAQVRGARWSHTGEPPKRLPR